MVLNSGDSIPDETTICRYRELFARLGVDKLLFESFNKQLEARNMILDRVTLVDATIKQAQAKPGTKREQDVDFTEDFARELEQRRLIEEQEKIVNCYRTGEIKKRLANARIDIWYLSSLSKNDITKYEEVRKALFVDGIISLEILIQLSI